jgi:hypothetical protein
MFHLDTPEHINPTPSIKMIKKNKAVEGKVCLLSFGHFVYGFPHRPLKDKNAMEEK